MRTVKLQRSQTAQGPLILGNAAHPLADGLDPQLAPPDALHPDVLLERQAAQLLSACVQAAGGWTDIVPVSGWRSLAEQRFIWEDTWDKEGSGGWRRITALSSATAGRRKPLPGLPRNRGISATWARPMPGLWRTTASAWRNTGTFCGQVPKPAPCPTDGG